LSIVILGWKSFAVNDSLKSGTQRHHQTLGFIPGDALPGPYCHCLHFLMLLGALSPQFGLQQVKCISIGFRSRDGLGRCRTFHFFALKKSLDAFAVGTVYSFLFYYSNYSVSSMYHSLFINQQRPASLCRLFQSLNCINPIIELPVVFILRPHCSEGLASGNLTPNLL